MQKGQQQDYFLGLDMGTDTLGWAVTDPDYHVLKCGGKAMWGVHLFERGKSAQERRMFRSARRRTQRDHQRMMLLRELFSSEICKVDPDFFARLDNSRYYEDDKYTVGKFSLFNDTDFTDRDYHKTYPTIYHLRSALIHDAKRFDIRLVYLAMAHILKHRGHFLFEGQTFDSAMQFAPVFENLINTLADAGISFSCSDVAAVEDVLKSKNLTLTDKKRRLYALFDAKEKQEKAICDALTGGSVRLSVLFNDETLADCEVPKIDFKSGIEEKEAQLEQALQDRMYLLLQLKAVYDWSVLADVLGDKMYLSDAKIESYEKHQRDLRALKAAFRKYAPNEYNRMFRSAAEKANYCTYTGHPSAAGQSLKEKICTQEEFCKFALKLLGDFPAQTPREAALKRDLTLGTALPKQVTKENSVVPYQLHLQELQAILDNARQHYAFLNLAADGFTVADKIIKLMTFRIPYYVGPLNSHSEHAWFVRKTPGKIYPWNFEDKVDLEQSAEGFIHRMTNYCTYLVGEKVLPKDSILYSKFSIYNQLNNLAVDGQKLPPQVKNQLFADLFLNVARPQKVTAKRILNYLVSKGFCARTAELTGIDSEIKGTMKAYVDFRNILGDPMQEMDMVEDIIEKITVFGESKKLLKTFLQREYGDRLTEEKLHRILKLRYTDWGRLSGAFLTEIYHIDAATGEAMSIMSALESTDKNLMQLFSTEFGFSEAVDQFNAEINGNEALPNSYDSVESLAVSPAVKRSIWRTLLVVKEVNKVMGCAPKRIFIEMARGADDNQKNKRTVSRKQKLLDCYVSCKKDEAELLAMLENTEESALRKDKLYLYYTQLGRCMYSGEPIDLAELMDDQKYDIDHIYPRSKTKDDSLQNRVLVKRTLNGGKDDVYPLPSSMRTSKTVALWKHLLELDLISKETYYRLMRTTPLTAEELAGFIARQMVETRQSTKATAHLLEKIYPDSEIVYVKAKNVSQFRQDFDFPKSRSVNDFHHAKDAYLNIVVGNVYHLKFTKDPANFIKSGAPYSLNRMFDFDVRRNGEIAWLADGTYIAAVRNRMLKNNILFTRYATETKGEFFKQQPLKAGNGQMPLKTGDPRLADMDRYGGYNKVKGAYFVLVRHTGKKGKRVKSIEPVPVYLANTIGGDIQKLTAYFAQTLCEPEVLLPKIKINTLFCLDGFKMHLSGRTGDQLIFKGANQLVLSPKQYAYCKRIDNCIERNQKYNSVQPISLLQKITKDENLALYDTFLQKLRDTVYNNRLSEQVKKLEKGRTIFTELSLEEQCVLLSETLKLFQCNAVLADLKLVGGAAHAGMITLNKRVDSAKGLKIIHQSVTGLFQNEMDISAL